MVLQLSRSLPLVLALNGPRTLLFLAELLSLGMYLMSILQKTQLLLL